MEPDALIETAGKKYREWKSQQPAGTIIPQVSFAELIPLVE